MSFYGINNSNNNNNGKRFHNRYVVPVSLGTTAAPGTNVPGNSRQSARNAAAEAAQHEQDRQMAARINRAVRRPGSLRRATSANVASGNKYYSSSSGANNGSKSSGMSPRYTSHIRRGTVAPLPAADKMRRYSSMNTPVRREIIANSSAGFKSALKVGGFPPLVPNYLLRTPQDLRNNADLRRLRFLLGMRRDRKSVV